MTKLADGRNKECLRAIEPANEPATEYLATDVCEGANNKCLLESTGLQKSVCVSVYLKCIFCISWICTIAWLL